MTTFNYPFVCNESPDTAFDLFLTQTGVDEFSVQYGAQLKQGLNYEQAALEYGLGLMHSFFMTEN